MQAKTEAHTMDEKEIEPKALVKELEQVLKGRGRDEAESRIETYGGRDARAPSEGGVPSSRPFSRRGKGETNPLPSGLNLGHKYFHRSAVEPDKAK
jgi:hypothetical protein